MIIVLPVSENTFIKEEEITKIKNNISRNMVLFFFINIFLLIRKIRLIY